MTFFRFFVSTATLLALPTAFLSAASVSGNVTCSVPGQSVTGVVPGTCSAQAGDFLANTGILAGANVTATIEGDGANLYSPLSSLYFSLDAIANVQNQPLASTLPASASATIYDSFSVTTAGPVRPGYIVITAEFDADGAGGAVGAISSNYFDIFSQFAYCQVYCIIPVSLGTTFQIGIFDQTYLNSTYESLFGDQYAQSEMSVAGNISFLEQDQSTPVSFVTDITPEPTSVLLTGFGLLLVATLRFIRLLKFST